MSLRYLTANEVPLPARTLLFVETGHCQLAEDSLFPQPCFQFLYPLLFGREDTVMFLTRQGYKVFWSIIIFDTIQMVNYPAFRQLFAICLLPNKDVLAYIASRLSSWMLRLPYIDITLLVNSAPSPITRMRPTHLRCRSIAIPPFELHSAASTSSRFWVNWLATIKASISSSAHTPIVSYYSSTMQGVQQYEL